MAKAPAKKKKVGKAKVAAKRPMPMIPPRWFGDDTCDLKRVCKYINGPDGTGTTKGLRAFLAMLWDDYKKLRVAVCNVERQAFENGAGMNSKPPKFCTGGGAVEPADPPKPPDW